MTLADVSVLTAETLPPVGAVLKKWRDLRRLSQLETASRADVSARHLSFIETGRAKPSKEMILRLATELDVPLRERNRVLLAGGYAPVYVERPLSSPQLDAVRTAIQQVLRGHGSHPAVLIDRRWNLLDANDAIGLFLKGVAPELLARPTNVLRLSLDPRGMAPRIANLPEWRAHLLARLRRQIATTDDDELRDLYRELTSLPYDGPEIRVELPGAGNVLVPLQFRFEDRILSFLSITAVFGTPLDITISELAMESFYPADEETARLLLVQGAPS
jgi:transcriptional regulator with XRE-family HTH domain